MIRERSFKYILIDIVILSILVLILLSVTLPFLHQIAVSFSERKAVLSQRVGLLPTGVTLDNFIAVMKYERFWDALLMSVLRVVVAVPCTLLVVVITAYPIALEKIPMPGRKAFLAIMIFLNLFQVGLIPRYLSYNSLGLVDNFAVLILPLLLNTFNIILVANFFKGIPYDLVESAMLDGATHLDVLKNIMLPLSKPALATVTLFVIVQHWNSWFDGIIYMRDTRLWPLGSYLYSVLASQNLGSEYAGYRFSGILANVSPKGVEAAMILVSALPVIIIYPLLQRYLISGMTLGAVKE